MIVTPEQVAGWRDELARLDKEIASLEILRGDVADLVDVGERVLGGIEVLALPAPAKPQPEPKPPAPRQPKPAVAAEPATPSKGPAPTDVADDDLACLSPRQRRMAVLARQGTAVPAIADAMSCTTAVVYATLSLIRKKGVTLPDMRKAASAKPEASGGGQNAPAEPPKAAAPPPPAKALTVVATDRVAGEVPKLEARPAPAIPAAPSVKPPEAVASIDPVVAWLKDGAGVAIKPGGRPGTWNVGYGSKLQPNLPPDAVVRYANGIRKQAGLAPFDLPARGASS